MAKGCQLREWIGVDNILHNFGHFIFFARALALGIGSVCACVCQSVRLSQIFNNNAIMCTQIGTIFPLQYEGTLRQKRE